MDVSFPEDKDRSEDGAGPETKNDRILTKDVDVPVTTKTNVETVQSEVEADDGDCKEKSSFPGRDGGRHQECMRG